MSIIYEALKKVEGSNQKTAAENQKPAQKFKAIYLLYIFAVVFGFFVAKYLFVLFLNPSRPEPAKAVKTITPVQPVASYQPQPAPIKPKEEPQKLKIPAFSLNGVVYDGEESFAIVNNQVVREGDLIKGAKIMRILTDRVDLEFKGNRISLKAGN